jgi:hypothetical protein
MDFDCRKVVHQSPSVNHFNQSSDIHGLQGEISFYHYDFTAQASERDK